VTTLRGEWEPVDTVLQGVGKLQGNCGCKGFTTSVLLQASCTVMSDVTVKGGDLLTQNCTGVTVVKSWVGRLILVNCVEM
jgi:hypothetical protein